MLTRCPQCATIFRVTSEQLKARQGQVRCGACHTVFNALDTLIEIALPATTLAPQAATAFAAPEVSARTEAADLATADDDALCVEQPPVATAAAEPAAESVPGATPTAAALATEAEPSFAVDPALDPAPEPESTLEHEPALEREPAFEPEPVIEPCRADESWLGAEPSVAPTPLAEDEPCVAREPEAAFEPDGLAAPNPAAEPALMPAPSAQAAAPEPSDTPPWPELEPLLHEGPTRRRWPWAVGIFLATLVFVAQAALHFRTEIAVIYPETRSLFGAVCADLGCEIRLPRKSELVGIEASDLHPDPGGRLLLVATLKNRAPFAQEYPYLELTLTDTADQPLVRRVIPASEYLLPKAPAATGFGANAELTVNLAVEAPGVAAVGYRLYLFYP
ncbi:MAG: zinc-ribbon domain-containing protein [Rhodocyclales bacterium]|nr:zinc-ribbon domain-containing protein [Rhodocyclales bacterium]